jgi:hypothetical protein
MSNQELLQTKAEQISACCAEVGLAQPVIRIVSEYAVNLIWHHEGQNHTLSLSWSPNRQKWTPVPNTDWLKQEVMPAIASIVGVSTSRTVLPTKTQKKVTEDTATEHLLRLYFADARDSLKQLEPFAQDNVDCRIVCRRAKEALERILDDPACTHLDRVALLSLCSRPDRSDFSGAKEYLTQCLTLCNIIN